MSSKRKHVSVSQGSSVSMQSLLLSHSRNKKRRRRRKDGSEPKKPIDCIRHHINNASRLKSVTTGESQAIHGKNRNVICLLFLIIDELPYEDIWKKWVEAPVMPGSDAHASTSVKVFVHAKYPEQVKSKWVKQHLIEKTFCPGWGTVQLTKAMVELARVALLNTKEEASQQADIKFLYASESCIPICTLSDATARLFSKESKNKSWMRVKYKPRNGYNGSSQWVPIENSGVIPPECVCKADQWVALTREHANAVLDLPRNITGLQQNFNVWGSFQKGCASDEMFFPTLLSCCGLLPNRKTCGDGSHSIAKVGLESKLYETVDMKQRLTFVVWNYADFGNFGGNKKSLCDRPEAFDAFSEELVLRGLKEGCIFVRKLKDKKLSVKGWSEIVQRASK